jgi:hypothetical protein
MPACKVAAEDPEGAFTSGDAKSGLEDVEEEEAGCCGQGGGLDIVSDTTLLTPRICQMSEKYSSGSTDGGIKGETNQEAGTKLSGPALACPALAGPPLAGPALACPALAGLALAGPALAGPALAAPMMTGPAVWKREEDPAGSEVTKG